MVWYIEDYNQYQLLITNSIGQYLVPKFQVEMDVEEPILYLRYNDRQRGTGGDVRLLTIDYRDVADGYTGYVDNPSSASDLMADIEDMIVSGFNPITDYDRDAQAYIDAVQILNTIQQEAVNDWFVYIKAQGIFTKLIAAYPFLGGISVTAKYNMMNPVDADAAFRLTFTGSPTFTANGVSFNGTTQYANTHIVPTTDLTQDSTTIFFSKRNTSNAGVEVGTEAPAASGMLLAARDAGNSVHIQYQFPSNYMIAAQATAIGRWGGVRTSNIVQKTFKNNVQQGATDTDAAAGWSNLTYSLYIGATNSSGSPANYCVADLDFVVIADGLSDAEYAILDNSVVTFNASIGR